MDLKKIDEIRRNYCSCEEGKQCYTCMIVDELIPDLFQKKDYLPLCDLEVKMAKMECSDELEETINKSIELSCITESCLDKLIKRWRE